MLDSLYAGLSGLLTFSSGLKNISNNVANLNTPGFKRSQMEYLDSFYRYDYSGQGSYFAQGSGVQAGSTFPDFSQGDFQETGGSLDVAIDGQGFFILQKDGKVQYSRAGQFEVSDDGYLVSRSDGARVAALQGNGLSEISINGKRSNPPVATSLVSFDSTLSTTSSTFQVTGVRLYDSLGVEHLLTLSLVNDSASTPGRWTFSLLDGAQSITTGEIRYSGAGTPVAGYETHTFSYQPTTGSNAVNVTLDFSASNYYSSSASSLRAASQNGRAAGYLNNVSINADGGVVLNYSNGQATTEQYLALAWFDQLNALQAQGGNRYELFGSANRILGRAGESGLGGLVAQSVELSNVDLAKEFSELIVVQRGYQAASQVVSAANEMIQQLGDIRGRR